jgi:hypothetical protein
MILRRGVPERPAAQAPPPEYPITSQIEGELRELRVRFGRSAHGNREIANFKVKLRK